MFVYKNPFGTLFEPFFVLVCVDGKILVTLLGGGGRRVGGSFTVCQQIWYKLLENHSRVMKMVEV